MKARIPQLLILSRAIIGVVIVLLSAFHVRHYSFLAVTLLVTGLLTDIFDGIIARRLGVSSEKLRRLDSSVDQFFFIAVAIATYVQCPQFFSASAPELIILFSFEAATYLLSFLKFRKEIATHSIGAKIWTLLIVATLVQVILQCSSGLLFTFCFWVGIITRLEIAAIILILKRWTNDVPTVWHAVQLRRNKEIKRHRLFNG